MDGVYLYQKKHNQASFKSSVSLLLLIAVTVILISPWQEFVNNLLFTTLKIERNSTWATFWAAVIITVLAALMVFLFAKYVG